MCVARCHLLCVVCGVCCLLIVVFFSVFVVRCLMFCCLLFEVCGLLLFVVTCPWLLVDRLLSLLLFYGLLFDVSLLVARCLLLLVRC